MPGAFCWISASIVFTSTTQRPNKPILPPTLHSRENERDRMEGRVLWTDPLREAINLLSREEMNDGPGNNAQDALTVRK